MGEYNVVQAWLDNVAYSYSKSERTTYVHVLDNLHGEERLKAVTELLKVLQREIEEIKEAGEDFWEKSARIQEKKKN